MTHQKLHGNQVDGFYSHIPHFLQHSLPLFVKGHFNHDYVYESQRRLFGSDWDAVPTCTVSLSFKIPIRDPMTILYSDWQPSCSQLAVAPAHSCIFQGYQERPSWLTFILWSCGICSVSNSLCSLFPVLHWACSLKHYPTAPAPPGLTPQWCVYRENRPMSALLTSVWITSSYHCAQPAVLNKCSWNN